MDVPYLSKEDLRDELALLHRKQRRSLRTAIYAQAEPGLEVVVRIHDGSDQTFVTHVVRCELEMRRVLSAAEDESSGEPHPVLLVDYPADELALDLEARIPDGRVHYVDRSRRLARHFNASGASAELLAQRELCRIILAEPKPSQLRTPMLTVDLVTGWRFVLSRYLGLPAEGVLGMERLLEHFVTAPSGPARAALLGPGNPIWPAMQRFLETRVGPLATSFFVAWLNQRIDAAAALTFILDAGGTQVTDDVSLRAVVTTTLRTIDKELTERCAQQPGLLTQWASLAAPLYARLVELHPHDGQRILAEADSIASDHALTSSIASSRYLKAAFESTGATLAALLIQPEIEAAAFVGQGKQLLDRLHLHERPVGGREKLGIDELLQRVEFALRLRAYLLLRPRVEAKSPHTGTYGELVWLADHYVNEGSFVDHARDRARGPGETVLEKAVLDVLAQADALREKDDARFASAYSSALRNGVTLPEPLVPIVKGLDRFAGDFLKNHEHRRLLVLLLDGMSWANAVELVQSLEAHKYGLLRGQQEGRLAPMLAALPTITDVSRSTLFGGKALKPSETKTTSKDPDRFASHALWKKLGIAAPQLYLRNRAEDGAGHASADALALIRTRDRVVGMVVNALDDQLKGARQLRVRADLATIKPLDEILSAATEAGRAILLIADHGHVLTDRMKSVGRTGDSKRYRYLRQGEPGADGEHGLTREDGAWVDAGKAAVALLAEETGSYGASAARGEHGGISLAEVITPALLVGAESLHRAVEMETGLVDNDLRLGALRPPLWWELEAGLLADPAPKATRPPKTLAAVERVVDRPQTSWSFTKPQPAEPEPQLPQTGSVWLERLRTLKIFDDRAAADLKRWRERIAPQIAQLADAGGKLPQDVFARQNGIAARNIAGTVVVMQEWINFDGYLIVEHDVANGRVSLDVALLDDYLKDFA